LRSARYAATGGIDSATPAADQELVGQPATGYGTPAHPGEERLEVLAEILAIVISVAGVQGSRPPSLPVSQCRLL
jgi:hypothetical protein